MNSEQTSLNFSSFYNFQEKASCKPLSQIGSLSHEDNNYNSTGSNFTFILNLTKDYTP